MSDQQIESILRERFTPQHLEIQDDSWKHAGHQGAKKSGGHFSIVLVSAMFEGLKPLERHRWVYQALENQGIHALALKIYSPEEWQKKQKV